MPAAAVLRLAPLHVFFSMKQNTKEHKFDHYWRAEAVVSVVLIKNGLQWNPFFTVMFWKTPLLCCTMKTAWEKKENLNVQLNSHTAVQRGCLHQHPTVSPDATLFILMPVINVSAEVCCFLLLGHVYYAVYIAGTNLLLQQKSERNCCSCQSAVQFCCEYRSFPLLTLSWNSNICCGNTRWRRTT